MSLPQTFFKHYFILAIQLQKDISQYFFFFKEATVSKTNAYIKHEQNLVLKNFRLISQKLKLWPKIYSHFIRKNLPITKKYRKWHTSKIVSWAKFINNELSVTSELDVWIWSNCCQQYSCNKKCESYLPGGAAEVVKAKAL